ncbi:DNA polymerase III subunit delta' [Sansalvadorimonas sp. 2012CJ34-2]|uniref:DNA polymerase III subunit delta' n=1 Tax=Parendozoicomonas callyspongiae TaxID=2942213 RepID=A0ABT0PDD9_9GAMM|nr:DNA polymerase III subunit delta' [Sansalvadorimonas sp. 2012CJ34-2]MCL6268762.1 DNA polymerase III subunit delta' [Sansalvadorimonas sp. 2012CJ34-2]
MTDSRLLQPAQWHGENWQQLAKRLQDDLLPHALLFRGQTGVGKRDFAVAFAQYVLCQSPVDRHSCGQCRSCQLNMAGTHPDFLLIEPEERGKQIKVDQVRKMIEFTEKTPQQGGFRAVVLCPAESMNISSANALLKCLEEPGRDTLLMLVSQQVSGLLPTIRSRCQQVLFSRPDYAQALDWLSSRISNSEQADTLLQLAAGEPMTALRYDQEDFLEQRDTMKSSLAGLTRGKVTPAEVALDWLSFDITVVLEWLSLWLQEMVRYRATEDPECLMTQDMAKMFRYVADRAGEKRLLEYYAWLLEQRSLTLSQVNLSRQLLLETVMNRWLALTV